MLYIGAGQKVTEDFIDYGRNALKNVAVRDPFVVVGGRGGYGEFIAFVPVPLRIYPVQRK